MATSGRLSDETERRLNSLASATGRPKAFYLRELIESGLRDLEEYYLAADVLARVRAGEEPAHSEAELRARLGLKDRFHCHSRTSTVET